jgi:NTE family protein
MPRMRRSAKIPLLGLVIASMASVLLAQDEVVKAPRPRIGLVLSGGGARGIAHVGVLQVLEELRIPVDYLAGTSMGSIVGGLYAYGLSPEQLRELTVRDHEPRGWNDLLRDGALRADRPMRRKQEDRAYLTSLRFGWRSGELTTAKGFLVGQNLEAEMSWLTREAHCLSSFDQLPIPFRCTAVDMADGSLVVLDHGNLGAAMRASMSLPMFFAPAHLDGHEYLDGGLADNVPIDVARRMGAEVLIVIDIGTPVPKGVPVDGWLGVSRRMLDILGQQNIDLSLATLSPNDVLVQPDLGTITSASFDRAAESIAIGAAAARAAIPQLQKFSVSEAEYQCFLANQRRVAAPMPELTRVVIRDSDGQEDPRVAAHTTHRSGQILEEDRLRADLESVHDEDVYQRVGFTVVPDGPGKAELDVVAERKEQGSDYVRFGLGLETNFQQRTQFSLGVQHTARDLNSLAAELRTTATLGSDNYLASEWYQPLDTGGWFFVAPRASVAARSPNLKYSGTEFVERVVESRVGMDVGAALGNWGELRVGYERAWGSIDLQLGNVQLAGGDFVDSALRLRFEVDTMDHPSLPSRGSYGLFSLRHGSEALGADSHYERADLLAAQAVTVGPVVVTPILRLSATLSGSQAGIDLPTLGGFLNLSGLPRNSDPGTNLGVFVLSARHRLNATQQLLDVPLYLGASAEFGGVTDDYQDLFAKGQFGGSVFLAADTPLGAVFFGAGLAEMEGASLFLFLGQIL